MPIEELSYNTDFLKLESSQILQHYLCFNAALITFLFATDRRFI